MVNAILSISEKREIWLVPVRELRRGSAPDAECCALDDLCGIQWECFWLETPSTLSGRKHSQRCTGPDTHKPQSVISVNRNVSVQVTGFLKAFEILVALLQKGSSEKR